MSETDNAILTLTEDNVRIQYNKEALDFFKANYMWDQLKSNAVFRVNLFKKVYLAEIYPHGITIESPIPHTIQTPDMYFQVTFNYSDEIEFKLGIRHIGLAYSRMFYPYEFPEMVSVRNDILQSIFESMFENFVVGIMKDLLAKKIEEYANSKR